MNWEKTPKNQAKANTNHNGLTYDNILSLILLLLLVFLNSLWHKKQRVEDIALHLAGTELIFYLVASRVLWFFRFITSLQHRVSRYRDLQTLSNFTPTTIRRNQTYTIHLTSFTAPSCGLGNTTRTVPFPPAFPTVPC